jgi:hypothetical protein
MGRIRFDLTSGRLVESLIWRFGVGADWEKSFNRGWAYGEWSGIQEHEAVRDCPVDRTHETGDTTKRLVITLNGGKWLPDFLGLSNHGFPIASADLVRRLRDSRLTGYTVRDGVDIDVNQSDVRQPKLYLFDITGRAGFCRRWRVEDAPNLCPYCRKEPILCEGCGWRSFFDCPKCGKRVHHGGGYTIAPDGKSFLLEGEPKKPVVEAGDWDGSDLFCVRGHEGGWFANRRAKDWFERTHVVGIDFEPALLNIEGLRGRLPDGSSI